MSRIEQLEAMAIFGDAFHDRESLNLAHEIIVDENEPIQVRGRALRMLDKIMGIESPERLDEGDIWNEIFHYVADLNS